MVVGIVLTTTGTYAVIEQKAKKAATKENAENVGKAAKEFGETFCRTCNEIAELVVEDSKSDREIVYAKHTLDTRIASIVGEKNFVPFDARYGGNEHEENYTQNQRLADM